ncbi:MAG: GerMN domain-containing protein [Parcubacteria group bacterium]
MNTKTTLTLIIIIILVAGVVMLGARILSGSEDNWICQNGEWVKHGNPSSFKPALPCEKNKSIDESVNVQEKNNSENPTSDAAGNDVKVTQPMPGDTINSPIEIIGEAKGNWFFEGELPVKLVDKNGKVIAETQAKALGEWMTTDFVPFRAILEFSAPTSATADLILAANDPSGQGSAKEIRIPVTLGKVTGMKIKLFFSSLYFDPESQNCEKVYEVERVVPKTKAVAKAALEELLGGITEEEKGGGYFTSISLGVKVNSVSVVNGVAKADFSSELGNGVGGSCRTSIIVAQITQTLKQFPTVKNVVISIDGKTEGILQP